MRKTYKAYNQFNFTILELNIDYDKKVYCLDPLTNGKPDKKTTRKAINEKVKELDAIGFKKISNVEWLNNRI